MYERILVPTDGSEHAAAALEYATDIAHRFDSTVYPYHVVDSRLLENAPHYDSVLADGERLVRSVEEQLAEANIQVEGGLATGVPNKAIIDYANDHDIDLIVMGSHGRTGAERFLLGSVTEKVLRRSDVPVLTVKLQEDEAVSYPFTDILVPTDGSEGAEAALDPALALAAEYGSTLHTLSVVDVMALGPDVRTELIMEGLVESAQSAVDAVEERAVSAGATEVAAAVEIGYPYSEIQAYVEANDIDLVVMGTHGRSGISRHLLGSVTEKLVRTCPAPVMTVRMPKY